MSHKASFYFKKRRLDVETGKKYHTCTKCNKEIVDSGNSNCKISHINFCHPETLSILSNKLKNFPGEYFRFILT